ncbi:hypothetical protein WME79_04145 [Sorangium sp. So ce726]|uniref:hypothetical protein n=1 Tax=Sorangium sp. So ce726 TaxID=3133319 RepID=UPI003F631345
MATPQETEERLRTWTLGQAERERLCLGLLALDERFSNVRPRRPKGGPDGGRDIEAVLDGSHLVWGGVGFRNNAIDSHDDKTWVRDKFRADVDKALAECADLYGFVFFTNIDLTPAEVGDLEAYARKARLKFVEIFYRERLRIGLDSPKGLAYRYQYLRLSMSDAEQAAFFAQLGGRIEELLTGRFDQVDQQLARIEFLHECEKPVRHVAGVVTLDGGYSPSDLGHFRFLFIVTKVGSEDPAPTLYVGGRDAYLTVQGPEGPILAFGDHVLIWSQAPDEFVQDTRLGMQARQRDFVSSSHMFGKGPFKYLRDFDEGTMMLWVTAPLFERLESVALYVNDYKIFAADKSALRSCGAPPAEVWKWQPPLTPDEEAVPWVEVGIQTEKPVIMRPDLKQVHTMWSLPFAAYTPARSEYREYTLEPGKRRQQ